MIWKTICHLRKLLSVLQQRTYSKKIFSNGEIDKLQYNVLEAAHAFYKDSLGYLI